MASRYNSTDKKRIIRALVSRQGLYCFYCRVRLKLVPPESKTLSIEHAAKEGVFYATIEHLRPLGCGGTNELTNLVLACVNCQIERHKGYNPGGQDGDRARG